MYVPRLERTPARKGRSSTFCVKEEQTIFQSLLQFRQCEVRRIRLRCRRSPPPHGVELPYKLGITSPSIGRGDLRNLVVAARAGSLRGTLGFHSRHLRLPQSGRNAIMGRNGKHG